MQTSVNLVMIQNIYFVETQQAIYIVMHVIKTLNKYTNKEYIKIVSNQ